MKIVNVTVGNISTPCPALEVYASMKWKSYQYATPTWIDCPIWRKGHSSDNDQYTNETEEDERENLIDINL